MNIEAEWAVLGSIVIKPDLLDECYLKPSEFIGDPRHPLIMQVLRYSYDKFGSIDFLLMGQHWGDKLERIGGTSYIMQIRGSVPTTANFDHYQEVVRKHYVEERLLRETTRDPNDDAPDLDETIERLEELRGMRNGGESGPVSMASVLEGHTKILTDRGNKAGGMTGAKTASVAYDKFTGGHQRNSYTVIGARPSIGKTQYVINDMYQAAKAGNPCVLFSLEMKSLSVVERMISAIGGIDHKKIKSGQMSDTDWEKYSYSVEILEDLPLYIDDSPGQTIEYIERQVKALKKKHPGIVIYIDFLQLIQTEAKIAEDTKRIGFISKRIIELKKKYDCAFIIISAVGRKVEERQDKRPMMSDLRDSGSIESDADIIAFLYRDEVYNPETPAKGVMEIIIAKGRDVGTATFWMFFNAKHGRFTDLDEDKLYELHKKVKEYEREQKNRKR